MSRRVFKYWMFIALILSRLVLGEFAHAMPHDSASPFMHEPAAEQSAAECPKHHAESAGVHHDVSAANETHGNHHSQDCCKGSKCECACAHLSALSPAFAQGEQFSSVDLDRSPASLARIAHRPDALFRPPA